MQAKSTPETDKEQGGKKDFMQTKSTPETDKEQGGKKRFDTNQIST
jgi:hypothetical protein